MSDVPPEVREQLYQWAIMRLAADPVLPGLVAHPDAGHTGLYADDIPPPSANTVAARQALYPAVVVAVEFTAIDRAAGEIGPSAVGWEATVLAQGVDIGRSRSNKLVAIVTRIPIALEAVNGTGPIGLVTGFVIEEELSAAVTDDAGVRYSWLGYRGRAFGDL